MASSQHQTCQELMINLRLRLGDPREGTFGLTHYARFTEKIDELRLILNEAQRAITVLCSSPTTSLLRAVKRRIQIISEATEYPLDDDYLSMDYVKHIKSDGFRYIREMDLGEFPLDNRDQTDGNEYYKYWDIYGVGSLEKLVGVVRQNAINELHDAYANFDDIRIGDIVQNLSDGSQAEVVSVVPATQILNEQNEITYTTSHLTVDSLVGGKTNRFQQGDEYVVSSASEFIKTMHVYPKIIFDAANAKVFTGSANNWSVQEPFVLQAIDVYLGDVPDSVEPDDRMVIEVLRGNTLASTAPASFTSKVGALAGLNRFVFDERIFPEGIRIAEDTAYSIRATVGDLLLPIQSIDVYSYGTSDYIETSHTRLPRKMEADHDICEIPPYALDLLYAQAVALADMKVRRAKTPDPALQAEIHRNKEIVDNHLWSRAPRGVSHLHDEQYTPYINDADRNFVTAVIGA